MELGFDAREDKMKWAIELKSNPDFTIKELKKHYRYYVNKPLEECEEFMDKSPFDEI